MAGGRGATVGDFALDPEVRVFLLDLLADSGDELADGVDAALGGFGRRRSRFGREEEAELRAGGRRRAVFEPEAGERWW